MLVELSESGRIRGGSWTDNISGGDTPQTDQSEEVSRLETSTA